MVRDSHAISPGLVRSLLLASAMLVVGALGTESLTAQTITTPATSGTSTPGLRTADTLRPFGTLREQAVLQQRWLELRMERTLPALMRREGVDMWVVPMREYNEDPIFRAITSPTTFAARRRTIYIFSDRDGTGIERIALGGSSQGGVFAAPRSAKPVGAPAAGGPPARQAELLGDEQWSMLRQIVEERKPRKIAINTSRVSAFADGLASGEKEAMLEALGPEWTIRLANAEGLAVDFIAARQPEEEATFHDLNRLAWDIITEAFSSRVITPGLTRVDDVLWWMRQRVNDLGLGTWFQTSVEVQRHGGDPAALAANPVILPGDVLHCDFGITALGLNTDTQHMGYVLRPGETDAPAGLRKALAASNRLQDITVAELRTGRTGNEVLAAALGRMRSEGIGGTVYSHPIGLHGHGAGPTIGLWDYQDGVPGRGDYRIIPGMWYSIELQATTPVPEWDNQPVRSMQEEDVIIDSSGKVRWAFNRQTTFHLVR